MNTLDGGVVDVWFEDENEDANGDSESVPESSFMDDNI
jgi:hypothetical protein